MGGRRRRCAARPGRRGWHDRRPTRKSRGRRGSACPLLLRAGFAGGGRAQARQTPVRARPTGTKRLRCCRPGRLRATTLPERVRERPGGAQTGGCSRGRPGRQTSPAGSPQKPPPRGPQPEAACCSTAAGSLLRPAAGIVRLSSNTPSLVCALLGLLGQPLEGVLVGLGTLKRGEGVPGGWAKAPMPALAQHAA